jgi:hypothetical protein
MCRTQTMTAQMIVIGSDKAGMRSAFPPTLADVRHQQIGDESATRISVSLQLLRATSNMLEETPKIQGGTRTRTPKP